MEKILVVDDYATNGMIVKQALTPGRYDVKIVTSGEQALSFLESRSGINLILLDINMPEMDGIETLKKIRKKKGYADIPIIFLSGQADKVKVLEGFKNGIDDVMVKPVVPKLLNERVERALRGESPVQTHRKNLSAFGGGNKASLDGLYDNLMNEFSKTVGNLAKQGKTNDSDLIDFTPAKKSSDDNASSGDNSYGVNMSDIIGGGDLW